MKNFLKNDDHMVILVFVIFIFIISLALIIAENDPVIPPLEGAPLKCEIWEQHSEVFIECPRRGRIKVE